MNQPSNGQEGIEFFPNLIDGCETADDNQPGRLDMSRQINSNGTAQRFTIEEYFSDINIFAGG